MNITDQVEVISGDRYDANWVDLDAMQKALELANISRQSDEFPFGAVVVLNGEIIASAENYEKRNCDVTAHAEIVAISDACHKLGRRDLSDCDLYSSTEPCPMCSAAIFQANIQRIAFGLFREDLPHLFRRRAIRIQLLAKDWDYEPHVVGGVMRSSAKEAFSGIEKPWRVKGKAARSKSESKAK